MMFRFHSRKFCSQENSQQKYTIDKKINSKPLTLVCLQCFKKSTGPTKDIIMDMIFVSLKTLWESNSIPLMSEQFWMFQTLPTLYSYHDPTNNSWYFALLDLRFKTLFLTPQSKTFSIFASFVRKQIKFQEDVKHRLASKIKEL